MDIKLRAKLSAYSLVDTFESKDSDHDCAFITPVSKEQIDKYLFAEDPASDEVGFTSSEFTSFVDSLFGEDSNV